MNLSQPVKGTPVVADGVRSLSEQEVKFYTTMVNHYKERCAADPCNAVLKEQLRAYKHIVQSKQVGTFLGNRPDASD